MAATSWVRAAVQVEPRVVPSVFQQDREARRRVALCQLLQVDQMHRPVVLLMCPVTMLVLQVEVAALVLHLALLPEVTREQSL